MINTTVGQVVNQNAPVIDLRLSQEEISHFTRNLTFKPKEAGKHFKKHGDHPMLKTPTAESYVTAARTNIVNAIFEKGFVIRTSVSGRVAFFTSDEQAFPNKMTSIGTFDGAGKLMTFYPANAATPSLTVKNFKGERAYIAYFEKGVSEKGWQRLEYVSQGIMKPVTNEIPPTDLDKSIDFLIITKLNNSL
jgi:hypothetical protein